MSSSACWATSLRSPARRDLRLPGVLGFNHRAHRYGFVQIRLQVTGYPRSQLPGASLSLNLVLIHEYLGSPADGIFASIWIYGIHQLSILPYLVSVISCQMWQNHNCPSLSKTASADLSLIYHLVVQIALISFILIKQTIDCLIALHLNLGYFSSAVETEFHREQIYQLAKCRITSCWQYFQIATSGRIAVISSRKY